MVWRQYLLAQFLLIDKSNFFLLRPNSFDTFPREFDPSFILINHSVFFSSFSSIRVFFVFNVSRIGIVGAKLQWKLLNGITLGLRQPDSNNWKILYWKPLNVIPDNVIIRLLLSNLPIIACPKSLFLTNVGL